MTRFQPESNNLSAEPWTDPGAGSFDFLLVALEKEEMDPNRERASILRPVLIVAGLVIILAGIKAAASIMSLFFLAVFLAIIFMPPFSWLRNKGMPSWLAMLIMSAAIIGGALLLFSLAWIPISQMDEKLPGYQQNLSNQISEATILLERFGVDLSSFEKQGFLDIGRVVSFLGAAILKIGNAMFLIFVVVLTAIFLVLEASSYPDRLRHGLGASNTVIDQYRSFSRRVNSYLMTRVKLNLAFAVPVTILLFVLGVDFPIFWGVVTFFVGFIPVIGFLLAVAPPAALGLIESGWVTAVIVIAGYTIINGVVDNVLQPRLMSQGLNLSPVVVFLSLFLWSFLLGGIGMLLAMPLTMLIVILFEQFEETRWLAVLMSTEPPQPIAVGVAEEEEALSPADDP